MRVVVTGASGNVGTSLLRAPPGSLALLDASPVRVLAGLREAGGAPTPPLDPDAGGPLRLGEFRTGVGGGSGT
jgi:uncharacterized protein YbjT (DUF2867 family)